MVMATGAASMPELNAGSQRRPAHAVLGMAERVVMGSGALQDSLVFAKTSKRPDTHQCHVYISFPFFGGGRESAGVDVCVYVCLRACHLFFVDGQKAKSLPSPLLPTKCLIRARIFLECIKYIQPSPTIPPRKENTKIVQKQIKQTFVF